MPMPNIDITQTRYYIEERSGEVKTARPWTRMWFWTHLKDQGNSEQALSDYLLLVNHFKGLIFSQSSAGIVVRNLYMAYKDVQRGVRY